jgi:hypothetical protein
LPASTGLGEVSTVAKRASSSWSLEYIGA